MIGNKRGKVGVGVSKGKDMKISTEKSYADAKKNMIELSFTGNTIPYEVHGKLGSAKILLKPARKGNGIVAGGAVRTVVSFAGISDISGKMLGSKSKLNNARATIKLLEQFEVKKLKENVKKEEKKEIKKDIESDAKKEVKEVKKEEIKK